MAGLLCGLILTLWIGFGQPKPKPPFKPLSVEGCSAANASLNLNLDLNAKTAQLMQNLSYIDEAYLSGLDNISMIVSLEDEVVMTVPAPEFNNTMPEQR